MNTKQFVLRETGMLALGEAICSALMVGVFVAIGYYNTAVLLGAAVGLLMAVANFFLMAVAAEAAADRAMNDDVKGGKAILRTSQNMRLLVMFGLLLVLAKAGVCNPFAMVIPLVLARPVLMVIEFFRKAGDSRK